MTRRMDLVVTVALEAMEDGKVLGRAEASKREDVTANAGQLRREPLARSVIQLLAGATADEAAEVIIDRLLAAPEG